MRAFLVVIVIAFQVNSYGQEVTTFTGTVDDSFIPSGTYRMNKDARHELDSGIATYEPKKQLLTDYFKKLNAGKEKKAKRILEKDKALKSDHDFTLSLMFFLLRMKELQILYKPCIQVNDPKADGVIISCTVDQLEAMKKDPREYTLECRYVGELIVDETKAYELLSFK